MEKQPLTRSAFFWADGVITAVSLVWTAHYLGDIYDGLSFGGFFALFLLLILFPYFLAMGAASVPHPLALAQLRHGVHSLPL